MTIMRWNPLREMAAMQSAIDRIFEDSWRGVSSTTLSALALDVHETDRAYLVNASLPGVKEEAIQVNWHDGVLTISAELPQLTPNEGNPRALLLERVYGAFTRSIRLNQPIDSEHVEAVYENGVLTLTLPKTPEVQPRQIPVRVNKSQN